jgi:hypothetical protein
VFETDRCHLSSCQCAHKAATSCCPETATKRRIMPDEPIRTIFLPDLARGCWNADVVGIRRGWVVGLHCVRLVGLEPAFAVLEIQQEHDGPEERVVYRNATCESAVLCFVTPELKNGLSPPIRRAAGEIGAYARAWDSPSRYPVGKLYNRFAAERTDYLHDRLWVLEAVHRPENESAYTGQ